MIYIYGLIVAVEIVFGQVLWKIGVERTHFVLSKQYLFSSDMIKFIFNPFVVFGLVSYGFATLLYMSLLSKYEYTSLQSVVVPLSLIGTFIIASLLFGEKVSFINFIGFILLIGGVLLITKF